MHQNKQNYTPVATFKQFTTQIRLIIQNGPLRTVLRNIHNVKINKMCRQI